MNLQTGNNNKDTVYNIFNSKLDFQDDQFIIARDKAHFFQP